MSPRERRCATTSKPLPTGYCCWAGPETSHWSKTQVYISHLRLTNYRNFSGLSLELPPGLVVLSGSNAQGKTNLLEAAYLLAIAKSYRTNVERELINWSSQKTA